MELNKPDLSEMSFRREFPNAPWLAEKGQTPFIEIACRAGGYLNPPLQAAMDRCDIKRDAGKLELAKLASDPEEYATRKKEAERTQGIARLEAMFKHCVVSWSTNIVGNGEVLKPTLENLMALAEAREPNTSTALLEFAQYVNEVANFIAKRDEEIAGN